MSLRNLLMTLNWLVIFLHMLETCSSKQSLSSTVIPNNSIDFCTGKENTWSVFPIIMAWCLVGLTNIPLLLYHSFAILSWCRGSPPEPLMTHKYPMVKNCPRSLHLWRWDLTRDCWLLLITVITSYQIFCKLQKQSLRSRQPSHTLPYSLRSKRFQSSYCPKVRAGAKKKGGILLSSQLF